MQFNRLCSSCRRHCKTSGAVFGKLKNFLVKFVRKPFWRMIAWFDSKSVYYCRECGHESSISGQIL